MQLSEENLQVQETVETATDTLNVAEDASTATVATAQVPKKYGKFRKSIRDFFRRDNLLLWAMILPTLVYLLIFNYIPLLGLRYAFQDFNPIAERVNDVKWVGFDNFVTFVKNTDFWPMMKNTLVLSLYSIVINTILPIILALFLNEIRNAKFKRVVQTISYAPYFISTVVVVGMLIAFCKPGSGFLANLFNSDASMMESESLFPHIYVISGVWQGLGWWAIIYVGTLANVDMSLHEAAIIDGAGRLKRMWHINFPTIIPMAVIMLIMSIGNMLSVGFEKVWLMRNPSNIGASTTISTYVYQVSLGTTLPNIAQWGYATAIGLFNSIINILLLCIANFISRRVSETSLW